MKCRAGENLGFKKILGFRFLVFFSTKTDVAKHESVTQKHLKSASHRTRILLKTNLQSPTKNEGNET